MRICRKFHFDAAHHLPQHEGRCKCLHGHRWNVEVAISGPLQNAGPETDMVIDFKKLDEIVNGVLSDFDHCCINDLLISTPTAEQICRTLFARIDGKLAGVLSTVNCARVQAIKLDFIRVYETPDCYAEWDGSDD